MAGKESNFRMYALVLFESLDITGMDALLCTTLLVRIVLVFSHFRTEALTQRDLAFIWNVCAVWSDRKKLPMLFWQRSCRWKYNNLLGLEHFDGRRSAQATLEWMTESATSERMEWMSDGVGSSMFTWTVNSRCSYSSARLFNLRRWLDRSDSDLEIALVHLADLQRRAIFIQVLKIAWEPLTNQLPFSSNETREWLLQDEKVLSH